MLEDSDTNFKETQVHYLRMNQRPHYGSALSPGIEFEEMPKPIDVQYYLELYQGVGLGCSWVDRLVIPEKELAAIINRESVHIYLIFFDDDPCGYVEMEQELGYIEIPYFGLFQEYTGRGFGAMCLKKTIEIAWSFDPEWIQMSICELDSSHALKLYETVGFELYTTRIEKRRVF